MTNTQPLTELIIDALNDLKAVDIISLDVQHLTSMTDHLVIASGTSPRHVNALADKVVEHAKASGVRPLSTQGEDRWVIVDLGDTIAHIMTEETREFYQLEKLWSLPDEQKAFDSI